MSTKLWYNQFAEHWLNAVPLGNGRIGAMFFGNPHCETIGINEESLWSGRQLEERVNAGPEDLKKIRDLISENRLAEANDLNRTAFLADPCKVRFYQVVGDILVDFADKSEYTDYYKELELSQALASASWKKGDVTYRSECFVSEAYDAMVYRVETDGAPFSCTVTMKRELDAYTAVTSEDTLLLNGRITFSTHHFYGKGGEGMSFGARLKVFTDGTLETPFCYDTYGDAHDHLTVKDATYVIIYGAFATNYNVNTFDIDESIDYRKALCACMDKITSVTYDEIKAQHLKDHAKWFSAVDFALEGEDYSSDPTNVRIEKVRNGERAITLVDICSLRVLVRMPHCLLTCKVFGVAALPRRGALTTTPTSISR